MTEPSKIDVHHHLIPEIYEKALKSLPGPKFGYPLPTWTSDATLAFMKKANIQKAILSCSAPGTSICAEPPALTRKMNEYTSQLCSQNTSTLGFFACLPSLTDTKTCISEIKHCLDVLKADGVVLLSSYSSTKPGEGALYLGNPAFAEVMTELNKRKAVVLIHPTHTAGSKPVSMLLPQPIVDYTHETTKTALDLVVSGTKERCPDIKFILSHAGGTVPYVGERAARLLEGLRRGGMGKIENGGGQKAVLEEEKVVNGLKSFWFDLALSCSPIQVKSLMEFCGPGKIMYGSDYPYAGEAAIQGFADDLKDVKLSDKDREMIYNGTAKALFPRFR